MKEVGFGLGQVLNAPPKWVIITVAILSVLIFTAYQIVSGETAINNDLKVRVLLYLNNAQYLLLALASLFGIKPDKKEGNQTP